MVNALQEVRDNEYVKNVDLFEHDFQRIIVEFDKMGECNAFCVAEKSDQLEQFLKANTCENMECIMDVAVEEAE